MADYICSPKWVRHCNARTNYELVAHYFNISCELCEELALILFERVREVPE